MIKLRDQIQGQVQSNANNDAPVADPNWDTMPVWLRYAEPHDQPEGMPSNDEPAWLRWRESIEQPGAPGVRVALGVRAESSDVVTPQDTLESGDPAYSLRRQLWQDNSAVEALDPAAVLSAQANVRTGGAPRGVKGQWLLLAGGVLGAIVLALAIGVLGFVNNRFFAPRPTAVVVRVAATWPATWTPTPTTTPTRAFTPTSTATATRTPLPTRIPPTRTPRPPEPTLNPYLYSTYNRGCQHSGGTYIEGRVNSLYSEVYGARVTLGSSPGGDVIQTIVTGTDRSPGYYSFIISAIGPRQGIYYVWVVDTAGKALSDPNAGRVMTNAIRNSDDPAACWQAFVDFVAVR